MLLTDNFAKKEEKNPKIIILIILMEKKCLSNGNGIRSYDNNVFSFFKK